MEDPYAYNFFLRMVYLVERSSSKSLRGTRDSSCYTARVVESNNFILILSICERSPSLRLGGRHRRRTFFGEERISDHERYMTVYSLRNIA